MCGVIGFPWCYVVPFAVSNWSSLFCFCFVFATVRSERRRVFLCVCVGSEEGEVLFSLHEKMEKRAGGGITRRQRERVKETEVRLGALDVHLFHRCFLRLVFEHARAKAVPDRKEPERGA